MSKIISAGVRGALNGSLQTRHVAPKPATWHPFALLLGSADNVKRYVDSRKLITGHWYHIRCPADVGRAAEAAGDNVFDVIRLIGWNDTIDSQAAWAEIQNRTLTAVRLPKK